MLVCCCVGNSDDEQDAVDDACMRIHGEQGQCG
jgi:hypothetical protein